MEHTIKEFETELVSMGVELISFTRTPKQVIKVFGRINNILHHWDAAGSCFCGQYRRPQHDIPFITVSPDGKTVKVGSQTHQLKRRYWWNRSFICKQCSIQDLCSKDPKDIYLKLCSEKTDGYFKLLKA